MDSSDSHSDSRSSRPAEAASADPLLQPEFAAHLKIGRCPANSQDIDPQTLEPRICSMPKIDMINPPVFGDQFTLKPYPLTKEDEIIGRNSKFSFKVDTPAPQPGLDLRLRLDKLISFDLNLNGQPVEMSLNPRKCGAKGRAGLCFKVRF